MIEIEVKDIIGNNFVATRTEDQVEAYLQEHISTLLFGEIEKHIEEMPFIDMEYNEEEEGFEFHASLVLCSKSDILSNAQKLATYLRSIGANEAQVEEALLIQTDDNGGF